MIVIISLLILILLSFSSQFCLCLYPYKATKAAKVTKSVKQNENLLSSCHLEQNAAELRDLVDKR
jgi:hypothetical protein